jgi:hypothetical protein
VALSSEGFSATQHGNNYFVWWQCDRVLDRVHHALYVECHERAEREASPTAAIIDSQSERTIAWLNRYRSASNTGRTADPARRQGGRTA